MKITNIKKTHEVFDINLYSGRFLFYYLVLFIKYYTQLMQVHRTDWTNVFTTRCDVRLCGSRIILIPIPITTAGSVRLMIVCFDSGMFCFCIYWEVSVWRETRWFVVLIQFELTRSIRNSLLLFINKKTFLLLNINTHQLLLGWNLLIYVLKERMHFTLWTTYKRNKEKIASMLRMFPSPFNWSFLKITLIIIAKNSKVIESPIKGLIKNSPAEKDH